MRHLSYANVMSTLALFAALGGSAFAAAKITGKQVKDSSLTGRDIRNRSLTAVDFKKNQLPAGPQGPIGPAGPTGSPGRDGAPGAPGTARAYALVDRNGGYPSPPSSTFPRFVEGHVKGFTAIRREGVGIFCLTPAAGIDAASATAVASPDWASSSTENGLVLVDHHNDDCDAGEIQVNTFEAGTSATPSDEVGFSILVG